MSDQFPNCSVRFSGLVLGNLPIETKEPVPLNEQDRSWIRETIEKSHKSHGWGKLTRFIKEWSGAGAAVAILILLCTQYVSYIEFRTHTNDTLPTIDSRLTRIEGDVAKLDENFSNLVKQNIDVKADLPQNQFDQKLASIAADLHSAISQGVSPNPVVVKMISEKLQKSSPELPGYWPASGALITFRSLDNKLNDKMPDCVDSPPKPAEIPTRMNDSSWSHFQITPAVYENCRFTLDSERDDKALNALMTQRGSPLIAFKHCLISYSGGEVNLILVWKSTPMEASFINRDTGQVSRERISMSGRAIEFVDCQFYFSIRKAPPQTGKKTVQTLLAQNGNSLSLPGPMKTKN